MVSRLDPEKAYLGVEEGVLVLSPQESGWQEVARISEIHTSVIDLVETKGGDLWVLPVDEGQLLRVRFGSNLVERYGPADGLPDSIHGVHSFDGALYVTGANDASYRFDAATRSFLTDVSLGARFGLMDGPVHLEQVDGAALPAADPACQSRRGAAASSPGAHRHFGSPCAEAALRGQPSALRVRAARLFRALAEPIPDPPGRLLGSRTDAACRNA